MREREGFIDASYGRLFYRVVGDGSGVPLLTLHGGPGADHRLLSNLQALGDDRPVIFYDQCGCGRSTIDDAFQCKKDLWTMEHLVREVDFVRKQLGLENVHLYGKSFGTMLGMDYLLTRPDGVASIIFSSPCLSAPRWKADGDRLRRLLPPHIQAVLTSHEEAGTTDLPEYKDAMMEFYRCFVCRLDPWPDTVLQALGGINMELYLSLWGPSEFYPTGTLKDYDRTMELGQIDIPTLFLCGRHDEATPETTRFYHERVAGSQFVVFENSAHLASIEEPERYHAVLRDFLSAIPVLQKSN